MIQPLPLRSFQGGMGGGLHDLIPRGNLVSFPPISYTPCGVETADLPHIGSLHPDTDEKRPFIVCFIKILLFMLLCPINDLEYFLSKTNFHFLHRRYFLFSTSFTEDLLHRICDYDVCPEWPTFFWPIFFFSVQEADAQHDVNIPPPPPCWERSLWCLVVRKTMNVMNAFEWLRLSVT